MRAGMVAGVVAVVALCAGQSRAAADLRGCYGRQYDAAHLASRPQQRTARLSLAPAPSVPVTSGRQAFALKVTVVLRGQLGAGSLMAECQPATVDRWACAIEGDGGGFTLTRRADGLRLDVTDSFLLETGRGVIDFARSDDRVFRLGAEPCR